MTAFWDTNVFIYLFEKQSPLHDQARTLFDQHLKGTGEIITSMLTLGELLAQPLRMNRSDQAEHYIELLSRTERLRLIPFDRAAAERYATIRATTSIRQPDAIQLACAASTGVESFVTNDQRLWRVMVPGIAAICGL